MGRLSQDTVIAIVLLLVSGGLMIASFDIREPDYGQLSPAAWPRVIVAVLGFLSFLYLIQSIRAGTLASVDLPERVGDSDSKKEEVEPNGAAGFLAYWRNVIWCFVLFLAYLLSMPVVGMLIGGVIFAFLLMNALGGWDRDRLILHAAIALICVGGMWALFTFVLKVPLPAGMILPRF